MGYICGGPFAPNFLSAQTETNILSHTVDHLLRELPFVRPDLDDFLILSPDYPTYLALLTALFEVLRKVKLCINSVKCILGRKEVTFWGYRVNKDGFTSPVAKVEAIQSFPKP